MVRTDGPVQTQPQLVPIWIGRLFGEGMLGRVGVVLECAFNMADERPKRFS